MPEKRLGKPRFWVSWLAAILGGDDQCKWKVWFKGRYKYEKVPDPDSSSLQRWRRNHDELVASIARKCDDHWDVFRENQTEFELEGNHAIVSGKSDLLTVHKQTGTAVVYDGKTGQPKAADWWQVLFYMYALPRSRADLGVREDRLHGTIRYSESADVIIHPPESTPERRATMFALLRELSADEPPPHTPSYSECRKCNITATDCARRVDSAAGGKTEDF